MIKEAIHDAERRMKSAIQSLKEDLSGIRTGRANPGLVVFCLRLALTK